MFVNPAPGTSRLARFIRKYVGQAGLTSSVVWTSFIGKNNDENNYVIVETPYMM